MRPDRSHPTAGDYLCRGISTSSWTLQPFVQISIGRVLPSMKLILVVLLAIKATVAIPANRIFTLETNITSILTDLLAPNRITFAEAVAGEARAVLAGWPGTTFIEAQATTMMNPTTNPKLLTDVRLMFTIPGNQVIQSEMKRGRWNQWADPHPTSTIPSIQWGSLPVDLGMDILEADQLVKEAGYGQRYWSVSVTWPLSLPAGSAQVVYAFEMEGIRPDVIMVLTKDRTVQAINWQEAGKLFGHRRFNKR